MTGLNFFSMLYGTAFPLKKLSVYPLRTNTYQGRNTSDFYFTKFDQENFICISYIFYLSFYMREQN